MRQPNEPKITILEPLIGRSGWLELSKLTVEAFGTDEFLILTACTDDGRTLDDEICQKLLLLPARGGTGEVPGVPDLARIREQAVAASHQLMTRRRSMVHRQEWRY